MLGVRGAFTEELRKRGIQFKTTTHMTIQVSTDLRNILTLGRFELYVSK
jgi:hypothetical protein